MEFLKKLIIPNDNKEKEEVIKKKKTVASKEKSSMKKKKITIASNKTNKTKKIKLIKGKNIKTENIKTENIKTENIKLENKKEIKFNKFFLPKGLIPKPYFMCINKNRDSEIILNDIHFKLVKNTIRLPKLNYHNKLHIKDVKDFTKLEDSLGEQKNNIIRIANYDNFTSNKKIGYLPKKIYNIDLNCGWTNAWRKMYELINKCQLIDTRKPIDKFTHFDICGFPGAFIFATNHFIKTHTKVKEYDWYIQSYNEKKTEEELKYLQDQYKLQKSNEERFLYGSIKSGYNGDITNVDNIKEYINFFKNKEVDLVSSDCGLNIDYGQSFNRETQMIKIHFGQFLCGIALLKKGGSFVMKNYSQTKPFSVSMIYLMTKVFKEVHLTKPESSRNFGNEIYLVCKNYYKNLEPKQINQLLDILDSMDNEKHIDFLLMDRKCINLKMIARIENVLNVYYNKLEQIKKIRYDVFKKEIVSLKDKPDLLIKKVKHMNQCSEGFIRSYFLNYFKKMGYRKIQNKDKLN